VDGHDAYPRDWLSGASLGVACALQSMAEDFMQGELAGLNLGELGLLRVQAHPHVLAYPVSSIGPADIELGGFHCEPVWRRRSSGLPDGGC